MGGLILTTFDWVPEPPRGTKKICRTMSDSGSPVRRSDAFG
jgi:hypothetical protein